jgi:hypothetical protein
MCIDQARQDCGSLQVYYVSPAWNLDILLRANRQDPLVLNDQDSIGYRVRTGAVDQLAINQRQDILLVCRGSTTGQQSKQTEKECSKELVVSYHRSSIEKLAYKSKKHSL